MSQGGPLPNAMIVPIIVSARLLVDLYVHPLPLAKWVVMPVSQELVLMFQTWVAFGLTAIVSGTPSVNSRMEFSILSTPLAARSRVWACCNPT